MLSAPSATVARMMMRSPRESPFSGTGTSRVTLGCVG